MADEKFLSDEEVWGGAADSSGDSTYLTDEDVWGSQGEPAPRKRLNLKNDPYIFEGDPRISTPGGRQWYSAEYPPYDDNAFVKSRKTVNGVEYWEHDGDGVIAGPDGIVTDDMEVLRAFGKTKPTKKALRSKEFEDSTPKPGDDASYSGEFGKAVAGAAIKGVGDTFRGAAVQMHSDKPTVDAIEAGIAGLGTSSTNVEGEKIIAAIRQGAKAGYINPVAAINYEAALRAFWRGDIKTRDEYLATARQYASTESLEENPYYRGGTQLNEQADANFGPAPGWEDSWTAALGQGLGSTAGFVPVGMAGGPAAVMLFGGAQSTAQQYDVGEAELAKVRDGTASPGSKLTNLPSEEQARLVLQQAKIGAVPGMTEDLPIELLLKQGAKTIPGLRTLANSPGWDKLVKATGRVFTQAMAEGGQEYAQQVMQNFITQLTLNSDQQLTENAWDGAVIGALTGGVMQGAVEGVGAIKALRSAPGKGDMQPPAPAAPTSAPGKGNPPPGSPPPPGQAPRAPATPAPKEFPGAILTDHDIFDEVAPDAPPSMHVNTQPSEAQKRAGNYKKGHAKIQGLNISIETPRGADRTSKDPENPWSVTMPAAYGYVKRTKGADGDPVDVFIGPNAETSDKVFVIDQVDPETGNFDEHKAVLGADTADEAARIYDGSYSDGRGPERMANMVELSMDEFKTWARRGNTTKPLWGNRMLPPVKVNRGQAETAPAPAQAAPETASPEISAVPKPGTAKAAPRAPKAIPAAPAAGDSVAPSRTGIEEAIGVPKEPGKTKGIARRDLGDDEAITASGRKVPVKYAVVEAADLIPSHLDDGNANPAYPPELQPRDRERRMSGAQVHDIASRIEPRWLDKSAKASDGAPIVSEDGVVESGNGRTLAIRRAYDRSMPGAERYRSYLKAQGYPVDGMTSPVLVRVRKGDMTTDERISLAEDANEDDKLDMSTPERAMIDARKVSDEMVALYRGGDIDQAGNRDFVRSFLDKVASKGSRGKMVDGEGVINQDGLKRIGAALLAKAYGDADLIGKLMESADVSIKGIGGALLDVAGTWAQMRAEAADGKISREVDQTKALLEAVRMVDRSRREGKALALLVGQNDIFSGTGISVQTEFFLALMFRNTDNWKQPVSRKSLSDVLTFFVTEARKTFEGTDLLGETAAQSKDILATAKRKQTYDYEGDEGDQGQFALKRPVQGDGGADVEDAGPSGGDGNEPAVGSDEEAPRASDEDQGQVEEQPEPKPAPVEPENKIVHISDEVTEALRADGWSVKAAGDDTRFEKTFENADPAGTVSDGRRTITLTVDKSGRWLTREDGFKDIDVDLREFADAKAAIAKVMEGVLPAAVAEDGPVAGQVVKPNKMVGETKAKPVADTLPSQGNDNAGKVDQAEPPAQPASKADDIKPQPERIKTSAYGSKNTLVSADRAAELRKRLQDKLKNQLNAGIDPEMLVVGAELAAFHIEAGARKFADFARAMASDLGASLIKLRPYLRSWYNGARDMMEDNGLDVSGMEDAETVKSELKKLFEVPVTEQAAGPPTAPAPASPPAAATDLFGDPAAPQKPKKPAPAPKAGGMQKLTDFGPDLIDGYDEYSEGAGARKAAFLADARKFLTAVASALQARGFKAGTDKKGKPRKPVTVNEAGIAVSGEVNLEMAGPGSLGIQVEVTQSALHPGTSIIARTKTATNRLGNNNWWSAGLTVDELAAKIDALVAAESGGLTPATTGAQNAVPPKEGLTNEQPAQTSGDLGDGGEPEAPGGLADGEQDRDGPAGTVAAPSSENDGSSQGVSGERGSDGARPDGPEDQGAGTVRGGGNADPGRGPGSSSRVADVGAGDGEQPDNVRPNYHLSDPERLIAGGPKTRFAKNRKAIETYHEVADAGRDPTAEELDAIAAYIGWGSFGQELFNGSWDNPQPKDGWKEEDAWLREHLGEEQWKGAQTSIINAHYTDPPTVTAMWDIVRKLGFPGGRVLEPSMGIGNFFALMPRDLMAKSDLTGIEMDPLTGGMAKVLYPRANVQVKGYQESKTPDGFYDLVIGNWPFSQVGPADRRYDKLNASLHDYFFIKALDQARPGGFVIGITSAGTLDKIGRQQRFHMASRAELVAAFRLPSGAFEKYAGTAVVTDLIIFQKREKARAPDAPTEDWINTEKVDTDAGEPITVNTYWGRHPENVLGHMTYGSGTTYGRAAMIVKREADFAERLAALPDRVPENLYVPPNRPAVRYIVNNSQDRQGYVTEKDGKFYVVHGEHLGSLEDLVKYKVKDAAKTAARESQLSKIVAIRKALGAVMDAERDGAANTEALRKTLKNLYDRFVQAHGRLAKSEGLAILVRAKDPSATMLRALEKKNGEPALIFTQATVRPKRTMENPTVRDAFVAARNESAGLSLARIAELAKVTEEKAAADLLAAGAILRTPGNGYEIADQYLSGNVRLKLREAEAALALGEDMQASVDALKQVIPRDIPYFQIEAKLGAPWVSNEVYRRFVADLLGVPDVDKIVVRMRAGYWKVGFKDHGYNDRAEATTRWGHASINFEKLLTRAFGNQSIRIMTKDRDGNLVLDTTATAEANNKAMQVREEFNAWAWRDAERRIALEKQYNEQLNAIATPRFDGSFLEFSGMTLRRGEDQFALRSHQANAIYRGLVNQRGIFAHEVGTGKTYTMGGIAIESRKLGLAQKPLLFAHNANSASVAAEVQEMYPGAKVLYVDNASGDDIATTLHRIANDDWDLIVVPHSLIDRFALTEKTLSGLAAEEIAALEEEALEAIREETGKDFAVADLDDEKKMAGVRSQTAKQLVRQREAIIANIAKMAAKASRENAIMFEDMGIDMVIVDEAHEFKKPPIATRMTMKGLNKDTSNRSIALNFLTHYVKQLRGGKGVFFFTGTPITNTLTEIFKMMRFVMDDQMQLAGVKDWDTWFNTFADSSSDVELTATGDYEPVTRLSQFVNVAELRRLIGQYMDIVFADDMPEFKPRETPSGKTIKSKELTEQEKDFLRNGRSVNPIGRPYKQVMVDVGPMGAEQEAELHRQIQLAQQFKTAGGRQRRDWIMRGDECVPIRVETAIANASLDVRLALGESAEDHPESKANRAIRRVMEHYREDSRATQVIFMERGFSSFSTVSQGKDDLGNKRPALKVKRFNLVEDIIAKLTAQGIPRDQIAVVDGSVSKEKRKEIADAMNEAKIRVVIGSTDTLGIGVNMQRHLRAMHHLDAPWMPGELIQRNGRGERQGNEWNTVLEYRYITDKLDGRRWQILALKERFIRAFLKATENLRVIEGDAVDESEDDDADGLAKTLSEAAGDPRLMRINKYRSDVERLERRERMHTYGIAEAKSRIRETRQNVERMTALVVRVERDVQAYEEVKKADAFEAVIGGKTYSERKTADEALAKFIAGVKLGTADTIGIVQGFPIIYNYEIQAMGVRVTISRHAEYAAKGGSIASIEATLRNMAGRATKLREDIAAAEAGITSLESMQTQPFGQQDSLDKAKRLFEETNADLVMNPVPPPGWLRHGAPVGTQIFVDGLPMDVEGHRYNREGWFVVTPQGDVPYLDAKDEQGNMLYEGRAFVAPVEKPWLDKFSDRAKAAGYKTEQDERGTWHVLTPGLATAATGPTEALAIRGFNMSPNFRDYHNTAPSTPAPQSPPPRVMGNIEENAPPFYSALLRTVEGVKMAKAPAAQWLATIKNQQGVKQEEVDWIGLADWLNAQPGPVTKEALADFIRANQVQVQEVVKRGLHRKAQIAEWDRIAEQEYGAGVRYYDLSEVEQAELAARSGSTPIEGGATKFSQYQLPGGENYREMLLTLPENPVPQRMYNTGADILRKGDEFEALGFPMPVIEAAAKFVDEGGGLERGLATQDALIAQGWGYTANQKEAGALLRGLISGQKKRVAKAREQDFRASHWNEPNVLAHVRFNERTADGKRTLFIEEIQSDWHQKGRKQGYGKGLTAEEVKRLGAIRARIEEIKDKPAAQYGKEEQALWQEEHQLVRKQRDGAPDAPFKTTWPELALKRMVRWAAENGFDQVAWTPGEVQADRYNLAKVLDGVNWTTRPGIGKRVTAAVKKAGFGSLSTNMDGKIVLATGSLESFMDKNLDEVFGKDLAEKIMTDEKGELEGEGLRIGGTGMKAFYDKMLVDAANKLGKKFGAKVKVGDQMPGRDYAVVKENAGRAYGEGSEAYRQALKNQTITTHTLPITPDMRRAAMGGQPLFDAGRIAPTTFVASRKQIAAASAEVERLVEKFFPGRQIRTVTSDVMPSFIPPEFIAAYGEHNRTIYVTMRAAADIAKNVGHESLHALRHMGLITENEWTALVAMAKKHGHALKPEKVALYRREYVGKYGVTEAQFRDKLDEEAVARLMGDYVAIREKLTPFARRVIDKLREWADAVMAALGAAGVEVKARKFMGDAYAGKIGQRSEGSGVRAMHQAAIAGAAEETTDTPAFERWFGDSKVVDEEGEPLVVYHGTEWDITDFAKGMTADDAFYFTPDVTTANWFAESNRMRDDNPQPNVIPVYLSIQNPKRMTLGELRQVIGDDEDVATGIDWTSMPTVVAAARREGYDGMHLVGVKEYNGRVADQWLAFEPGQVKSIHNGGRFDPSNPMILGNTPDGSAGGGAPAPSAVAVDAEAQAEMDKYTASINLHHLTTSDAIKRFLVETTRVAGEFTTERRGTISHEQTIAMAEELGLTEAQLLSRKTGEMWNNAYIFAARTLMVKSGERVLRLAKRAMTTNSRADLGSVLWAVQRHLAIQEQVAGLATEAGRALDQFNIAAAKDFGTAIDQILHGARTNEAGVIATMGGEEALARELVGMIAQLDDPSQVSKFLAKAYKATALDMVREFWVAGLLSGLRTFTTNLIGNLGAAMWQIPTTAVAAGIGAVRGGENRVRFAEVTARMNGLVAGSWEGAYLAWKYLKTGDSKSPMTRLDLQHREAIPGKLGYLVRTPFRVMEGGDQLFKEMNRRAALYALATRQAMKEQHKGQALQDRIGEIVASPSVSMRREAWDEALYGTFQSDLGPIGRMVMNLREVIPGAWLIVPFIKTGANLGKVAVENTPAAALSLLLPNRLKSQVKANLLGQNGQAAQDTQLARIAMGTGLVVGVVAMVAAGMLTGGGPDDPDERAIWLAAGNQPYSVKVNGTWYSYQRIDWFALVIGTTADFVEASADMTDKAYDEVAAIILHSIANVTRDKSWFKGPAEFFDAFFGKTSSVKTMQRYVRGIASSFAVPNIVNQFAQNQDPVLRDAQTMWDEVKERLPYKRQSLLPRRTIFGEPKSNEGSLGPDLLSPIWTTTQKDDPVLNELLALKYFPSMPARVVNGHKLTPEQYDRYVETSGKDARARMDKLLARKNWTDLSDDRRIDMIATEFREARDRAREALKREWPDLRKKAETR